VSTSLSLATFVVSISENLELERPTQLNVESKLELNNLRCSVMILLAFINRSNLIRLLLETKRSLFVKSSLLESYPNTQAFHIPLVQDQQCLSLPSNISPREVYTSPVCGFLV
jgi:hypothetical protein